MELGPDNDAQKSPPGRSRPSGRDQGNPVGSVADRFLGIEGEFGFAVVLPE